MSPIVLLLGATGNTGSGLVAALGGDPRVRLRTATRSIEAPTEHEHVRFDWFAPDTHAAAVEGVERLYLVAPVGEAEPVRVVEPFLARALSAGVRRVVVLSSSAVASGDPGLGLVDALVRDACVEWEVLRPSWFMQNFVGHHPLADSIRASGEFVTATDQGRVAFIDAHDVGRCAAALLVRDHPAKREHLLTGPDALTYSEAAEILSAATGRPVRHTSIDSNRYAAHLVRAGYEPAFAAALAALDVRISAGEQGQVTDAVERITGTKPRSFADFLTGCAGSL